MGAASETGSTAAAPRPSIPRRPSLRAHTGTPASCRQMLLDCSPRVRNRRRAAHAGQAVSLPGKAPPRLDSVLGLDLEGRTARKVGELSRPVRVHGEEL